MKHVFIISLVFISHSLFGQNHVEIDTVKMKGFLFTETSIRAVSKKKSKTNELYIDSPSWNFFIPSSSIANKGLKEVIDEFHKPIQKELYLAMCLTDSSGIYSTNFGLNKMYPDKNININSKSKDLEFLAINGVAFKIKNDDYTKRAYKATFVEGEWLKVKIPWKWKDLLSIGSYKSQVLDPEHRDGYYYYFLIDATTGNENKHLMSIADNSDDTVEII